jgi:uncharacterized protein YbjQ (UPF0145 family)
MPLFRRESGEERAARRLPEAKQEASAEALMSHDPTSAGGVPAPGRERLAQLKGKLFTSNLSVKEFLLVKLAGFDPLGLVLGSSIYHVGFDQSDWKESAESLVLSQAMYRARELAMTRMVEEAGELGADGVVAVHLDIGRFESEDKAAEFIAIGTAVKQREGELQRAPDGRPFTSGLSGQDFWTLLSSGYRPVGLVMGSCVYHVGQRGLMEELRQLDENYEMVNYTQALYSARELAMERMQREAEELQAEGVVGVQLQQQSHGWDADVMDVIEFFALGTAVVPMGEEQKLPELSLTLSLTD